MMVPKRRHHCQASVSFTGHHSKLSACQRVSVTSKGHRTRNAPWTGSIDPGMDPKTYLARRRSHRRRRGLVPWRWIYAPKFCSKYTHEAENGTKTKTTQDVEPVSEEQRWLKIPPLGYVTERRGPPRRSAAFHRSSAGVERQTPARGSNRCSLNTGGT